MIKGIPALAVKREVFTQWCLLTSLGSQGTGGRGRVVFALGPSCFFPAVASLLSLQPLWFSDEDFLIHSKLTHYFSKNKQAFLTDLISKFYCHLRL